MLLQLVGLCCCWSFCVVVIGLSKLLLVCLCCFVVDFSVLLLNVYVVVHFSVLLLV